MGKETAMRGHSDEAAHDDCWPPQLVELFRQHRASFVRLAYLLTGHRAVAEEIVQDAFIGAQRSWAKVGEPYPYLRAAVVNRCRSWGRHQHVVRTHRPPPPEPTVLEPDELWDALAGLEARRRAAIVLRFYADLPHAEIARILGCRPSTVRTSIFRELRQLRREIER
jgi:RNA polymerase sigma factor (sigma-70 family)